MSLSLDKPSIAIVGGTGPLGSGLASRLAAAGYPLVIGSRSADKAEAARERSWRAMARNRARRQQRGGRQGRRRS